jgi:pimeloyl-ACP methyl ester carboxylesterase
MRRMICEVNGIPIYYETAGEGRPFLMLHGGYIDHRHMEHDLEPIFDRHPGWQRIYPDLPGHGRTPAPDWLATQDQVLGIVLAFIDQVIGHRRFALAGVSRGGYLARGVVARRAVQIDGALLITPARPPALPPQALEKVILARDEAILASLNPVEADLMAGYVVQDEAALAGIRRNLAPRALADESFQARIFRSYEFSFDVDEEPASFDKPALILAGRQDTVVGYIDAWKIIGQYPRATFALLDRAGHYLPTEQDDLLGALASEWLRRVEEALT